MPDYTKPLPFADAETKPYWDWAKKHELRMQRCADCGEIRFPPRPDVPGLQLDARRVGADVAAPARSTAGWSSTRRCCRPLPPTRRTRSCSSSSTTTRALRLVGTVVDIANDELAEGIPVEVVFDDVTPEITLPKWRRRRT